ncbi:MAG: type II secretion system protein [Candidatus Gastranaerophilaceae bacterium]
MHYFKGLRAFTLAEVLITLGIIGVVAAMTMPVLIQNHKEKETVAKLKKLTPY